MSAKKKKAFSIHDMEERIKTYDERGLLFNIHQSLIVLKARDPEGGRIAALVRGMAENPEARDLLVIYSGLLMSLSELIFKVVEEETKVKKISDILLN